MGAMIIYGAYMPRKNSISSTVCIVALFDTVIALVAGLVIFPIVFANGLQPSEGPGLMFVTIPLALGQMHFGQYVSTAFFILVAFAAWTSAISMIEPVATWIIEKFKFSRAKAIGILGILLWLVGTASALSLNHWSGFKLLGLTIFDLFDFVSANILLPLGGLLIALFAGWVMQPQVTQAELAMKSKLLYKIWLFLVRFLAPVAIFIVFVVNLWGAIAS
jgi:NSS family neurotransmitter:Na+ symporter